ncbi:MAG: cation:proton antiporter, partial [Candidatus Zixiibacteriota bacterium]
MEEEILKWIPFIIFVLGGARIFGYISERYLKQGVVLGELMFGVLIAFALKSLLPHMSTTSTFLSPVLTESKNITILLTFLSPYGVIFLLFKAGVNSHFSELCKVWKQASLVALIGVIAPGCGGYFLLILLHFTPESALLGGATLTATSVAIATRILDHHKKINSPEGNIILGAAVIDDIMGLLTLSLIPTLIILLTACNQAIDCRILTVTIAKIAIFLVLVFIIGQKIMPHGIKIIKKTTKEIRIITIFLSCLFFSYLAKQFGLATILGAFAVGLFLSDEEVKKEVMPGVEKLCFILVPIFFVNAGS